jgi:alpha-beta hydrolase superfamily lysophospholipase
MDHYEFTLKTIDNLDMFVQTWQPEVDPKAVVCLVHGLGEHSGRYTHVAQAMNDAGYALVAMDLRGHGKSAGKRGCVPYYNILRADIDSFFNFCKKQYPGLPSFIYGHSMGGVLVLDYVMHNKPMIQGVIDSSGWLRLTTTPSALKVLLGRIIGRISADMTMFNGLDPNTISRDSAVVLAYRNDPLVHDRISARLGISIHDAGEQLLKNAALFPQIPLLIMHGLDDQITSPAASRQFAGSVTGDVVFKPWKNLYHELHNEPEKQLVLDFAIKWMNAHL